MANSALYRTNTAPSASGYKYTFSAWVKRSKITDRQQFWRVLNPSATTYYSYLEFQADDKLHFNDYSSNGTLDVATNRLFRDTNAWYHIMAVVDTTQGTASDRIKLYINGAQETSLVGTTYSLGQNQATTGTESGKNNYVGGDLANNTRFFNGYMSHVSFVDGQALAPTVFGQTDSTSGIWKFKSPTGVTWGNNGYHLKFENSGNLGLDSSGEGHNLTVSGNGRQALDTPSNVSVTLNPLVRHTGTVANGNTTYGTSSSSWIGIPATLGNSTGKWYWEYKLTTGAEWSQCGIVSQAGYNGLLTSYVGGITNGVAMNTGGGDIYTAGGSAQAWFGSARSVGQIISVALDCDNNKIYWGTNGVWGNSSNPATGSNGYSIPSALNTDKPYFPAFSVHNCTIDINFGNGHFGATAITSAGSNGNGSLFEYDVPSGFYALNTKNINTYG